MRVIGEEGLEAGEMGGGVEDALITPALTYFIRIHIGTLVCKLCNNLIMMFVF